MVILLEVVYTTANIYAEELMSKYDIAVIEYTKKGTQRQAIIAYNTTYTPKLNILIVDDETIIRGDKTGDYYELYYNSTMNCVVVDKQFKLNKSYYELNLGLNVSNIVFYGNSDHIRTSLSIGKHPISDVNIPNLTIDDVNEAINNSLNATTNTTVTVNNIVNNTTNVYNQYKAGDITYTDLIYNINNNVNQLNELNNVSGNTLADLIAINNGLTYNQIIQDTALEDRNESFWNSKDISPNVESTEISHNTDEKQYLSELTSETTQKLSDFAVSGKINQQAKTDTVNILSVLYNNEILKIIIPLAATFMLVCVILGIKYRL